MTKLAILRRQIAALRRQRQLVRWSTGYSALLASMVWALLAVFAIDVAFAELFHSSLDVVQRSIVMVVAGAGLFAAFYFLTRPFLGVRETDLQMALFVERQQQIDSDLVAALQFESAEAATWGSVPLERAVVDYVSQLGRGLNVFEGFSREQMIRRALALVASLLIFGGVIAAFPGHARTFFFDRLLLGSLHYPTATSIDQVSVNSTVVLAPEAGENKLLPNPVNVAQGQPVTFTIHCSGKLPDGGVIKLVSTDSAGRHRVDVELTQLNAGESKQTGLYVGQLVRMVEPVAYRIYLGDAWTDEGRIEMIPLPVVEPRLTATPPEYARRGKEATPDPSTRQLSVIEGSAVNVAIECTNDKRLTDAWLTLKTRDGSTKYSLQPLDETQRRWRLPIAGTPLAEVAEELRFELQVTDDDGLHLESPIGCAVRLRTDRPPTGSASLVHRVVLPDAQPILDYTVNDDYGVADVRLKMQVQREERTDESDADRGGDERATLALRKSQQPLLADQLPYRGRFTLALSSLKLVKGDRLKLALEVIDDRGDRPGQSYESEPLVLEISDESGVLAAISEADERSEQRLSDIIKQQLGIGESP